MGEGGLKGRSASRFPKKRYSKAGQKKGGAKSCAREFKWRGGDRSTATSSASKTEEEERELHGSDRETGRKVKGKTLQVLGSSVSKQTVVVTRTFSGQTGLR